MVRLVVGDTDESLLAIGVQMVAVRRKKTSKPTNSSFEANIQNAATPRLSGNYRRRMWLLMFAADLLGFLLTLGTVLLINQIVPLFRPDLDDLKYLVVVVLCWGFLVTSRLYPGVGINPADEIRLVTQSVSLGILIGLAIFTVFDVGWVANGLAFGLGWAGTILSVVLCRWVIKIFAAQMNVWGEPVIVVSKGPAAEELADYFLKRRRLGLVPVRIMADLAMLGGLQEDHYLKKKIYTAVVGHLPAFNLDASMVRKLSAMFKNVIFISSDLFIGTSVQIRDLEGLLGFETSRNTLGASALFLKRLMDIILVMILSVIVLPICIMLALLIWLEGRGPIFYAQERLGLNGQKFNMFKFRTMVVDAERKLQTYLKDNADARSEWGKTQKLQQDPRITRVGRWLRKWSLAELPQFLTVLRGEMSLVGPRPILYKQATVYGNRIEAYLSMRPGISGMWQVSGRNKTTFEERADFDGYYVRNWSIWLDFYIILRTVWVVLRRYGAY